MQKALFQNVGLSVVKAIVDVEKDQSEEKGCTQAAPTSVDESLNPFRSDFEALQIYCVKNFLHIVFGNQIWSKS